MDLEKLKELTYFFKKKVNQKRRAGARARGGGET